MKFAHLAIVALLVDSSYTNVVQQEIQSLEHLGAQNVTVAQKEKDTSGDKKKDASGDKKKKDDVPDAVIEEIIDKINEDDKKEKK